MRRICPECSSGKHRNCDGTAWNEQEDRLDSCQCEEGECHTGYPQETYPRKD